MRKWSRKNPKIKQKLVQCPQAIKYYKPTSSDAKTENGDHENS